jgi:transcriptional regulator with XRE-family HTH domain
MEREKQDLSGSALARASGISKAAISQIESGKAAPSIETLWALSDALGVTFASLVEPRVTATTVIRAGHGSPIAAEAGSYRAAVLSACPPGARRDIYLISAEPGDIKASTAHPTGTTEHLILISGAAQVGPEDAPVDLLPGDYVAYAGDRNHVFIATTPGTTAILVSELK